MISVSNLCKTFNVQSSKYDSIREELFNFYRRKHFHKFNALKDISFNVKKGEFFSIIGRNGSGKSTLLKLLANIYTPNGGSINIRGSISPFLELGIGFNNELTAYENIFLNGLILGLTRKEIKQKFETIIEFSELFDFIDTKLKYYSTGMIVRLSFSLAIQANKDILLLDEVLAVGDANFQKKCLDVLQKNIEEGRTIIFVSHNLDAVRKYSGQVMVMEKGQRAYIGNASDAIEKYMNIISDKTIL